MNNPVLVEVTRGTMVESRHRGAVAVMDAKGATVFAVGDVARPVFPRSAVKAFQALPLLESGAADRYGLTPAEIALAVASHSGEPAHAETAAGMLAKAGRDAACLECGAHWPMNDQAARDLAAAGRKPSALHNNCSGKHAGFVCLACHLGEDPAGYVKPEHRVQREVKAALEEMTGTALGDDVRGVDGCSIPTYAIPLTALATGFARFGAGEGMGPERRKAAEGICDAAAAHPWNVAGTGRLDTVLMEVFGRRVFMKTGAEGVYCAALPELGLGVALKADDGAKRAAECMFSAVLARTLPLGDAERARLDPHVVHTERNWNGIEVGTTRPTGALA
ncbi:asparaginase [Alsobacter soli]|uniref:Asparaginase n=1 Tax=Alsobacter soli TaxID=2109933 RepID=A0A2T1HQL6_9HYPH|nr:asparaginase [Alsobacter soli]PSC03940.1 asparaginase [Alsobacter soli]